MKKNAILLEKFTVFSSYFWQTDYQTLCIDSGNGHCLEVTGNFMTIEPRLEGQ